jgi:hypothetical protein
MAPWFWEFAGGFSAMRTTPKTHFKPTFLVLVRKAPSLVSRAVVGNWLHGVAYRTALKARAAASRRRVKERTMLRPEPFEEHLRPEWHALLDRELNGLPEKYRTPIILCDLEGKTRREAARLLRCPEGTISGRLSRARALLARRLARGGLTLSGGAVATALSQGTAAGVPPSLAASTIRAAASVAAGPASAAGVVSLQVAALSEGVLKAMLLTKLRTATAVLLAVGLLGLGVAAGVFPTRADEPNAARTAPQVITPGGTRTKDWDPGLLPPGPLPRPAFVSLSQHSFEMTMTAYDTTSEREILTRTVRFPRQAVQVYDMGGKKVEGKRLTQIQNKPVLGLFMSTSKPGGIDFRPLSLYLTMFKEDTLLFVLNSPAAVQDVEAMGGEGRIAPPPPGSPSSPLAAPAANNLDRSHSGRAPASPAPPPVPQAAPLAPVPPPPIFRVDSTRFKLPFAFSHPAKVSNVELWLTRDEGQTWQKFAVQNSIGSAFVVDVAGQGLHGFTVVPVSDGVGRRPRPGDLPQVWVEVDSYNTTALLEPEFLRRGEEKLLTLRWRVTLKKLPARPILLSYAKTGKGPWLPLDSHVETGVENTGQYQWRLPADAPEKLIIRLQVRTGKGRDPITILRGFQEPEPPRPPEGAILGVEPVKEH